jgi:mutator protein MutT
MQQDYIKQIRAKVGTMPIILNFGGACVVNDAGEILLQQRDKEGLKWGFPGGALDYGESFEQAAAREVKEETGIEVVIDKLLGIYDVYFAKYPNGDEAQTIVAFYVAHPVGGTFAIDNKETFNLKWYKPAELPELFNEQHRAMLADYLRSAAL